MKTKKGRKAPNDSATEFKVGFKKKGNDGNMWQVMKTTKGVKRWIKDDKKLNCKDMVLYQKRNTIRVRSYKQGKRVTKTRKNKIRFEKYVNKKQRLRVAAQEWF